MKILVTGAAGFIGYHLVRRLCERGDAVVGLDNINAYYDVRIKYGRLRETGIAQEAIAQEAVAETADTPGVAIASTRFDNYRFVKLDITEREKIDRLFAEEKFDRVCHLAAQAGVRYSLTNPHAYMDSNIIGFLNVLEACRHNQTGHLVYASSSSVYGLNENMPFSTHDNVDHPVSLYAASKKSNELMAHSYSHLYALPTTGLRFFTVYGPWGRPDMALFLFTRAISEGKPIDVFDNGNMQRDFTYVDDIVEGVMRAIDHVPTGNSAWSGKKPDPASSPAPYKIYNIGNNAPVKLMDFIEAIEAALGKKAVKNFMPLQMGDVPATWADATDLVRELGYAPHTDIRKGIEKFVEWYTDFFGGKHE